MTARRVVAELLEAVATGLLAAFICVGSAVLWIGIPAGGMWLAGEVTAHSRGASSSFVLGGIPLTMIALRLRPLPGQRRLRAAAARSDRRRRGGRPWLDAATEERPSLKRLRAGRSLLDVSMAVSVVAALVLLLGVVLRLRRDDPGQ